MRKRYLRFATVVGFFLAASVPSLAQSNISDEAMQQIADILAAKGNFTAARQKMDSNLAFGILAATNDPSVASFQNALAPIGATDVNGNPVLLPPVGADLAT